MSETDKNYLQNLNATNAKDLPNGTTTLVLGILSIIVCFVCGIIAFVISNKDLALYKATPELYTESSYKNIKIGRTCAIIGIVLQVVGLILYIFLLATLLSAGTIFNR
jgi:M penetrans paralogue family 26